jgi:sulfonate transport system substrate-binding protein
VAKSKGWLTERLEIENARPVYIGSLGEIALTNEALATDQVDMFLTSTIPPVIGRSAGIDVRITWLSCVLISEIIVGANASIEDFSQLKGKKIGTLTGSDSHYWLLRTLSEKGYDEGFLEIIFFSRPDNIVAAFESGDLDAVALFPPFPEQSLIQGTAKVLGEEKYPIEVVMVGRGGFIDQYPNLVVAVNSALDRAKDWIKNNPGEAKSIVSESTGISIEIVEASWPKLDWESELSPEIIANMQMKADFLRNLGKIKSPVNIQNDLVSKGLIK